MSGINHEAPARPVPGLQNDSDFNGLTARQHAAIALCVPDSGTDWLDAMIEKRILNEFAGQVMTAIIKENAGVHGYPDPIGHDARYAFLIAGAMLAASKKVAP